MIVNQIGSDLTNYLTNYKLNSAATTNATSVKATPGRIASAIFVNTSAAVKYIKLYNKATAPVVGTDVPIMTVAIPATSSVVLFIPCGIFFSAGIALAITGLGTDADVTAVALNDVIVNLQYA